MIDIFIRDPNYCIKCGSYRTIECYDNRDKPIFYTIVNDTYTKNKDISILDKFNNRNLSYMKCKKCNTKYIIDWSLGFPMPLWHFDNIIDNFLEQYSNK